MRIATDVLQRFIALPPELLQAGAGTRSPLRDLLDDLGLEVKRAEAGPHGEELTLELLANRGDHHCYEGVAREIAARYAIPVCSPEHARLALGASPVTVRVESAKCLVYTATLLVAPPEEAVLPASAQRVLAAAKMASVSGPVDATNIANLELGQPTHAFDADTIVGGIAVRESRPGERAWPLFTAGPVDVPPGTLVIADDVKILAIAGVIGCEESKTTATTRRILLESAAFDAVSVRIASRALGIHTDSSARFERGSDPARPVVGAGRVVHLLESAGWQREGATGFFAHWVDPHRVLALDTDAAARFLGSPVPTARVAQLLGSLGFSVEGEGAALRVRVPPHRLWDVETDADLYEEIAKIVGYNTFPTELPPVGLGAVPSPAERRKAAAEEVIVGAGFHEVFTDGFYGRPMREKLGFTEQHPLWRHVETQNALDRDYSLLKNNALGQALEGVASNVRFKVPDVKLYEWTHTFHPTGSDGAGRASPASERRILWLVAAGTERPASWGDRSRPADVAFLKGLVRELGVELGLALAFAPADPAAPLASCLHPNRQATVALDGRAVGIAGEVHPSVLKAFKIKGLRPVYLELDAVALLGTAPARPAYSEPPTWLAIERDLAFTLVGGLEAGDIAAFLHASGPAWLDRVAITDAFDHEEAGRPVRTITFQLRYANAEPARSTESVNAATEALIAAVQAQFGDRGVKLRGA